MFWFVVGISMLIVPLMVNGLIHQERLRLWNLRQEELAEQTRLAIEEKKRLAGEKIKLMLKERRNATGPEDTSDAMQQAVAEMNAALEAEKSYAARN